MRQTLLSIGFIILLAVAGLFLLRKKPLEPTPTPVVDNSQKPVTLVDGRQCYTFSHEATKDEPYTVSELLDITIIGSGVAGNKTGQQSGPDMTNGYTGTITGTMENNAITDIYSYTIEGSHNQEKELYRASLTGIEKLRYPLVEDKNAVLVPDTTQPVKILNYARVPCTASN